MSQAARPPCNPSLNAMTRPSAARKEWNCRAGFCAANAPDEIEIEITGLKLRIDPLHAQKTGFYLDQLPNYALVAEHAKGRRVLDCFANQGAFGLACARAGAREVVGVEAGAESVRAAEREFGAQPIAGPLDRRGCFPVPPRGRERPKKHSILSFSIRRHLRRAKVACTALCAATRNCTSAPFSCFRLTECWRHFPARITWAPRFFEKMMADALVDARRSARRLRHYEQALDHPVLPTLPETEYFRGMLLEMMPGR